MTRRAFGYKADICLIIWAFQHVISLIDVIVSSKQVYSVACPLGPLSLMPLGGKHSVGFHYPIPWRDSMVACNVCVLFFITDSLCLCLLTYWTTCWGHEVWVALIYSQAETRRHCRLGSAVNTWQNEWHMITDHMIIAPRLWRWRRTLTPPLYGEGGPSGPLTIITA